MEGKEKESLKREAEVMVGEPCIVGRDGLEYRPKNRSNRPLNGLVGGTSLTGGSEKGVHGGSLGA